MRESLQQKFTQLLLSIGATEPQASKAWSALANLYQEPRRYYHTLDHIENMLSLMESHVPDSLQSVELHLSIWYHDLVYNPESTDNELNSAKICTEVLTEMTKLSPERIERIHTNIMSTKGHQVLANGEREQENQLMLDLDLSILGSKWEKYLKYSEDIRLEYSAIPLPDYKVGRAQVLKTFLEREEIYFSEVFKKLFEEKARKNLQKEIEILEK